MTPRGDNLGGPGSTWPGGLLSHIEDWGEFAVDYLDGRLSPDDKAAVEQHLADCPSCASRMAAQQSVITFLQRTSQEAAPEDMEDAVLGELLFPSHAGAQSAFRGRALQSSPPSTWTRRLRPWMPVTVAVAVILMGIVAFGLLRPNSDNSAFTKETTTIRVATGQDAAAGATSAGAPLTTVAAGVSTTAAAGVGSTVTSSTTLSVASASLVIRDRKEMLDALQSASGPAYVAFEALPASESTATDASETATTVPGESPEAIAETIPASKVDDVVSQIAAFTGLEQLSPDLSMGGPTFAAFVSRKQLTPFLDLLFSIKSSVTVDLALRMDPEIDLAEHAGMIAAYKAQMPVLSAQIVPQPAVVRYFFTTSTLVPASGETTPSNVDTPDDEGTHILIVIFVRR